MDLSAHSNRVRVLLIEDNESDALLIREMMRDVSGGVRFKMTLAESLGGALHALQEEPFDVLLLDLSLPDSHGLDTFAAVHAKAPERPIVILSGLDDEMAAIRAVRQGAQDYLVKGQVDGPLLARSILYAIERCKLERRLREAQKVEAVGRLAGGIAHDFNNILGVILGYTQLAKFSTPEGSPVHHHLTRIFDASQRARDLVAQILALGLPKEQALQPITLGTTVRDALKDFRGSIQAGIDVRENVSSESIVLADAAQMRQVVTNLCANAVSAMRERGGTLEVNLSDVQLDADFEAAHPGIIPGAYVRMSVKDTGHGMDGRILERIFDPFFTTKGFGEGPGLGLSVVQRIVQAHGGLITVESEPGRGSSFNVFLRRFEPCAMSETIPMEAFPTGNECVLFVDDEPMLCDLGKELLSKLGYEIVVEISGPKALEVFREHPERFDLVITDMMMPDMTGVELAGELLRIRPEIPIILCTAYSKAITPEKARAAGFRAFLRKPFVMADLADTVRRTLDDRTEAEEIMSIE